MKSLICNMPGKFGNQDIGHPVLKKGYSLLDNEQRLRFCKDQPDEAYTSSAATENVSERLREITNGDFPTVVIDATGSRSAINRGFLNMAHGARYMLVGLQKEASHPEFHKREATLMSSRNANRTDFEHVMACMKKGLVKPTTYITHRVLFNEVADEFANWLKPEYGVIKALVEL